MISDLQSMKVDQLKLTIRRLNETCMMHLRISGVKSDLVSRVYLASLPPPVADLLSRLLQYSRCRTAVYELAAQPDKTRFNLAKRIISEARDS